MTVKYTIPATTKQGTCEIVGTSSFMETPYENALWQYNSMRAHDGQPPVRRLPEETKSTRID